MHRAFRLVFSDFDIGNQYEKQAHRQDTGDEKFGCIGPALYLKHYAYQTQC